MVKFGRFLVITLMGLFLGVTPGLAKDPHSVEEVQALVEKAHTLVVEKGIEDAKPLLHDKAGEFWSADNELYAFVIDYDGNWVIYPPKPAGEGQNLINVKDVDGKALVREMIELAKTQGSGWTEYRWMNPATQKIQKKKTFVQAVDGQPYFVAAGFYMD
ncbi:MAG: cache domain-containing protein [Rhodospirillum sp.]|nr:cache domain-containing protein [Rhodospirillum sp.]MCF8488323.1 cache domain-containing protein [Rhodospirillum sp.]MCF8500744.1 cache domain-containing protein [Rhodospirillum sp.]